MLRRLSLSMHGKSSDTPDITCGRPETSISTISTVRMSTGSKIIVLISQIQLSTASELYCTCLIPHNLPLQNRSSTARAVTFKYVCPEIAEAVLLMVMCNSLSLCPFSAGSVYCACVISYTCALTVLEQYCTCVIPCSRDLPAQEEYSPGIPPYNCAFSVPKPSRNEWGTCKFRVGLNVVDESELVWLQLWRQLVVKSRFPPKIQTRTSCAGRFSIEFEVNELHWRGRILNSMRMT
jgi:hypothetical protein